MTSGTETGAQQDEERQARTPGALSRYCWTLHATPR